MSGEDFDIESLANYLHLPVRKVARLAERGRLPGRRVGGQWRFSPSEIHHWLEQRIGASDEAELLQLEDALRRATPVTDETYALETLLPLEAIDTHMAARTRASVVRAMVDLAARTGWLWDPETMVRAVEQREEMHPTATDGGIALLHPRRPLSSILERPFLALGRTTTGIPFGDPSGGLTNLFFLICSVDDAGHLQTLARLGRILSDKNLVAALRQAETPEAVREQIVNRERELAG